MMKMLPLLGLLALCGCSLLQPSVPANRIVITTPRGSYNIDTPKNVDISKFSASINTNGVVQITFDKWTATNDPNVIDKSSAGQIGIINAWRGLLSDAVYSAANGAVQGATKP